MTATGLLCALLTLTAIMEHRLQAAFLWMCLAVFIDAIDGPLARRFRTDLHGRELDGALLDNIVDFLNYTFIPLVLIAHEGWVPGPAWLWVGVPGMASLYAFAHREAKDVDDGFFRGFPSYWNIMSFYVAVELCHWGPWPTVAALWLLALLSVAPVRFVYPNRAPRHRWFFIWGGVLWSLSLVWLLIQWPNISRTTAWISFIYPALYMIWSVVLDRQARRRRAGS